MRIIVYVCVFGWADDDERMDVNDPISFLIFLMHFCGSPEEEKRNPCIILVLFFAFAFFFLTFVFQKKSSSRYLERTPLAVCYLIYTYMYVLSMLSYTLVNLPFLLKK